MGPTETLDDDVGQQYIVTAQAGGRVAIAAYGDVCGTQTNEEQFHPKIWFSDFVVHGSATDLPQDSSLTGVRLNSGSTIVKQAVLRDEHLWFAFSANPVGSTVPKVHWFEIKMTDSAGDYWPCGAEEPTVQRSGVIDLGSINGYEIATSYPAIMPLPSASGQADAGIVFAYASGGSLPAFARGVLRSSIDPDTFDVQIWKTSDTVQAGITANQRRGAWGDYFGIDCDPDPLHPRRLYGHGQVRLTGSWGTWLGRFEIP